MSDAFTELSELFRDKNFKLTLALVERVFIAPDSSFLRAECKTLPDLYTVIAEVTTDSIGGQSITLPNKDDLVLLGFTDDFRPIVLNKLFSETDKIPGTALTGDSVFQALTAKKAWVTSDTRINLSKGEVEPTENLVLGQQFKTFADNLLTILSTRADNSSLHKHIGNMGIITSPTDKAADDQTSKADLETLQSSPIGDDAILSNLSYTEKGV